MANIAGVLKNNLSGKAAYKSFIPAPLPPVPRMELDADAVNLLVQANKQIAALEGIATHVPNVNLFVSMYVRKLFSYLETNPIIEIRKTAAALRLACNTTASAVTRLCEADILEEVSGNQRNRLFSYKDYPDILREGT
jgi:Fic family protein